MVAGKKPYCQNVDFGLSHMLGLKTTNGALHACDGERLRQLGRRYSDFSHPDTCIRAAGLPNNVVAHLPTLPTTFTFNKFSDSVVDARRTALDRYVRALLTAPSSNVLASLPEVHDFFEEETNVDAIDAH